MGNQTTWEKRIHRRHGSQRERSREGGTGTSRHGRPAGEAAAATPHTSARGRAGTRRVEASGEIEQHYPLPLFLLAPMLFFLYFFTRRWLIGQKQNLKRRCSDASRWQIEKWEE